jgi:putative membrane protein insertion efficiency factor
MRRIAVAVVRLYRSTIGLAFAGRCKYHPTCSQYAIDALSDYGVLRGAVLVVWRLARCNPWSHGGVDYAHQQRLFRTPAARIDPRGASRP